MTVERSAGELGVRKGARKTSSLASYLLLCRFSDAGNRGSIHTRGAAGVGKAPRQEIAVGSSAAMRRALWGFSRGAGVDEVGQKQVRRSVCSKPRMVASGVKERSARCATGFAVPIQANAGDGCGLVCGRRRASGDGKYHSCGRLAVTAS